MEVNLPNLELLVYKSKVHLLIDKNYLEQYGTETRMNFEVESFPQTWGSTALGFDTWGGRAITKAYTTVVHEINSNFYCVFFNSRIAYIVFDPSDAFFADLKEHQIASVSQARSLY